MSILEMKKLRPRGIKLFKVTENWWSRVLVQNLGV